LPAGINQLAIGHPLCQRVASIKDRTRIERLQTIDKPSKALLLQFKKSKAGKVTATIQLIKTTTEPLDVFKGFTENGHCRNCLELQSRCCGTSPKPTLEPSH